MSVYPNFERLEDAAQTLDDQAEQPCGYRVALPHDQLDEQGRMLDWVIGFALDELGAQHLDLRIVEA
jgi:hypothetical protein